MKDIQVNLATYEYIDKRLAVLLISGTAILILLISVTLMHRFFGNAEQLRQYNAKLMRVTRLADDKDKANIGQDELTKKRKQLIDRRVREVNTMIARDIFPWGRLLEVVERSMPEGLHLDSFVASEDYRKLTLKGRAVAARKVSFFLKRLDDSRLLADNVLLSLKLVKTGADSGLQFTIESKMDLNHIFSAPHYRGIAKYLADAK